ncbi:hypothetical protein TRVA0_009S01684 [Trichomonascus vanleenenianus]|uniref:agmatinase n=1 Tax=Trichomonascus vanleenenianus TaxID=2268995 RepID=UPI003EC97F2B
MKLLSLAILSALINLSTQNELSFLDKAFGPFSDVRVPGAKGVFFQQSAHSNSALDDYEKGKIHLPHKDFREDLPIGPLYSGIVSFEHLPLTDCFGLSGTKEKFDIAIVGAPFDTAVTYRPGARFGPAGIREGSRRTLPVEYSAYHPDSNPFELASIVECGDVGMDSFDNRLALDKLYRGHRAILDHETIRDDYNAPRVITLGGDHTVTFSALRAAYEVHGPISVIHFDSHIDTWDPEVLGGNMSSYAQLNHGTFLHYAHEQGYITNESVHVGIRAPYVRKHKDSEHDAKCGFQAILAREIDSIGAHGIVEKIKKRVGSNKVYITLDIDVLDPAYAPGTGTAEPGGFTTRELLTILDGLKGLDVIGADVVEVSPPYDTNGQITVLAAAEMVQSFLYLMTSD